MTALAKPRPPRMTSDEFIAWAMEHAQGGRLELVGGEVVGMAPERASHARVKAEVYVALREAIADAGLPCEAFADGMAVEVDDHTICEPDATVRCGARFPPDAVKVTDPIVVVEVLSPSTRAHDAGAELADYFRMPSVQRYLILDAGRGTVIHHARSAEPDQIATRVLRDGAVHLDPPGIELDAARLFPAA
jgi:Uma2 family endonuclease